MQPQTVIVMGPSGAGKGTQTVLLREFLEQQDPQREVLGVQVGKLFRDEAEKDGVTAGLLRGYLNDGLLMPEFLTVWAWGETLVGSYTNEQHVTFDGTPRRIGEAKILHEALQFYGRKNLLVIVLSVSKEWSRKMLAKRKREDDIDPEDVERRLNWYDTDVVPVINFFRENSSYCVVDINGERPMAEVHQNIIKAVRERYGK